MLADAGVKHTFETDLFPGELNRAVDAGETVIVNVNSHFFIVDGKKIVNGQVYYLTRDPYKGPRGVLGSMLDKAMSQGVNAIKVGK